MEAKKCDRCGKLYEYTPVTTLFEKYDANDSVILRRCDLDGNERKAEEWDLCPECKAEFEAWISAWCIKETAPAEAITTAETYALVDAAKEAEAQRVRVGEYWQENKTGEIVKVNCIIHDVVIYNSVSANHEYRQSKGGFLADYTKKGGAE